MEKPVSFSNKNQTLHGIYHQAQKDSDTSIVFLHGWGTYRIGPHRIFVEAARVFTEQGFHCLRFDFRGRGESEGDSKTTTLVDMIDDSKAAADFVTNTYNVKNVIYLGLCSGGEVAVASAMCHPAVKGLILWSTPLLARQANLSTDAKKTADHAKSYWQKLFNPNTWRKLISFQVNYRAIAKVLFGHFIKKPEKTMREKELLQDFNNFRGKALFVYGTNDPVTEEAKSAYEAICQNNQITAEFELIPDANHNFYALHWKSDLINRTCNWLKKNA